MTINSALIILVVVLSLGSAAADCLSQYGPGCSNCVNVTLSLFGHRRLLQDRPLFTAQHARGGRGNGFAGRDRPRRDASMLVCTACDTTGYVLRTETRGSVTFGSCGEFRFLTRHCGVADSAVQWTPWIRVK